MLQQTQVATVIPYYEKFLTRFPTVDTLADSELDEVLTLWSGLGYYSRARNLHRGAQYVARELKGTFPRTRDSIRLIPGIGPYTAGAILSIAFDLPEPLVDGNVQRVFARYFAWPKPIETTSSKNFFWEKAAEWVKDSASPRVLNQALMELGATVCTKGSPRCEICPLASACRARKSGQETSLPLRKKRRKSVELWWLSLIVEKTGSVWLRRNREGEWWKDLWDVPRIETSSQGDRAKALTKLKRRMMTTGTWTELDHKLHTVTHHRIEVSAYQVEWLSRKNPPFEGEWIDLKRLGELPLSSLARKILGHQAVLQFQPKGDWDEDSR